MSTHNRDGRSDCCLTFSNRYPGCFNFVKAFHPWIEITAKNRVDQNVMLTCKKNRISTKSDYFGGAKMGAIDKNGNFDVVGSILVPKWTR